MAKSHSTVSAHSHAAQSVMARILATENIRVVVDPKMNTAAFDLKNRTLLLPQWKDMSKTVYDMLIGHEISHALHTPAEGWRETCNKISGTTDHNSTAWQTASLYLNVVEDARIERLIQIKFPGFRRDFIGAYNELNAKNFFGVKGKNMNTLGLADRINLYYKLGTIGSVGITFTDAEDAFIRRIDSATSFADAALIAADLFKFCNEQQHKQQQQNAQGNPQQQPCNGGKSDKQKQQGGQSQQQDDQDGETGDSQDNGGNVGGDEQGPGQGSDAQDGEGEQNDQGKQPADQKQPQSGDAPAPVGNAHSQSEVPPAPMTQQTLNQNLKNQVEQNPYDSRIMAPTELVHCNLSEIMIDCKKIVETARTDFPWMWDAAGRTQRQIDIVTYATKDQTNFMRDSKKQIDLLMKQFELRKAAQIAKRESVRKTGILDTVRMVNYKHSEDIFRRNTMLPEGKNHGLVMFVDWSGSMAMCLEAVMEQTMVLVEFCRRMQIPYEVFAFTTRSFANGGDLHGWTNDPSKQKKYWKGDVTGTYGTVQTKEEITARGLELPRAHSQFALMNLLSSRLSRTEHQDMVLFLRALVARQRGDGRYFDCSGDKSRWELSGTALDETIVAAMQIVPQFKSSNKLDIVNTIFLTDGETSVPYISGSQLIDPSTKAVYSDEQFRTDADANRNMGRSTDILLLALRDITKANVVGMFLAPTAGSIYPERYFRKEMKRLADQHMSNRSVKDRYAVRHAESEARRELIKTLGKQFNEDNCLVADAGSTGYSEFFIIKSTARVLGDEIDAMDEVQQGATQAAIKKAFLKSFDNKNKSRVLINRFIELIAR